MANMLYQSSIRGNLYPLSPDIYYKEGWRNLIEDHLTWLMNRSELHRVDPSKAYVFQNDLMAYLQDLNIPYKHHWVIMRMNNMINNWDFTEDTQYLLMPTDSDIDFLTNCFTSNEHPMN